MSRPVRKVFQLPFLEFPRFSQFLNFPELQGILGSADSFFGAGNGTCQKVRTDGEFLS